MILFLRYPRSNSRKNSDGRNRKPELQHEHRAQRNQSKSLEKLRSEYFLERRSLL